MNPDLKLVLDSINSKGYKAFVVGGYVRDYLKYNKTSTDIDIATDIPSKDVLDLFSQFNPKEFKYGTVKFNINNFNFDIAHFRNEKLINNSLSVDFTDSMHEDSFRRDFTINAIYMDTNLELTDFHNGLEDLQNNLLKFIGDVDIRLQEDPTRILRYIYFLTKYDFKYDEIEFNVLKNNALTYLNRCSLFDINKYVVKIIELNKVEKLLNILTMLNIKEFFFENFNCSYDNNINSFLINSKYRFMDQLPNKYKKRI